MAPRSKTPCLKGRAFITGRPKVAKAQSVKRKAFSVQKAVSRNANTALSASSISGRMLQNPDLKLYFDSRGPHAAQLLSPACSGNKLWRELTGIFKRREKAKLNCGKEINCYSDLPADFKRRPTGLMFRALPPLFLTDEEETGYETNYEEFIMALNLPKTATRAEKSDKASRARLVMWKIWFHSRLRWIKRGMPNEEQLEHDRKHGNLGEWYFDLEGEEPIDMSNRGVKGRDYSYLSLAAGDYSHLKAGAPYSHIQYAASGEDEEEGSEDEQEDEEEEEEEEEGIEDEQEDEDVEDYNGSNIKPWGREGEDIEDINGSSVRPWVNDYVPYHLGEPVYSSQTKYAYSEDDGEEMEYEKEDYNSSNINSWNVSINGYMPYGR